MAMNRFSELYRFRALFCGDGQCALSRYITVFFHRNLNFLTTFSIQIKLQVAMQSFELVAASKNHEEMLVAEPLRIPFLKLALQLATELGQPRKAYERELSELR